VIRSNGRGQALFRERARQRKGARAARQRRAADPRAGAGVHQLQPQFSLWGAVQTFTSLAHPEMVRYDPGKNRLLIEAGGLELAADEYQARLVGYSSDQPKGIVLADYEQYEVTIKD
jgi:hypothetical protein